MSIEINVKIKTKKIDAELTQQEARELYEQLKGFFEAKETVYIPYENPLFPPAPWQPNQPYYIGDFPSRTGTISKPTVTFTCRNTSGDMK